MFEIKAEAIDPALIAKTMTLSPDIAETAVRRRASRLGFAVLKAVDSRRGPNNQGKYRLVDANNRVVLGECYEASLDDILIFLDLHHEREAL